jgi:hypothetical protein
VPPPCGAQATPTDARAGGLALSRRASDLATRVIGIADLANSIRALAAVEQGPLPSAAIGKLESLWATDFH